MLSSGSASGGLVAWANGAGGSGADWAAYRAAHAVMQADHLGDADAGQLSEQLALVAAIGAEDVAYWSQAGESYLAWANGQIDADAAYAGSLAAAASGNLSKVSSIQKQYEVDVATAAKAYLDKVALAQQSGEEVSAADLQAYRDAYAAALVQRRTAATAAGAGYAKVASALEQAHVGRSAALQAAFAKAESTANRARAEALAELDRDYLENEATSHASAIDSFALTDNTPWSARDKSASGYALTRVMGDAGSGAIGTADAAYTRTMKTAAADDVFAGLLAEHRATFDVGQAAEMRKATTGEADDNAGAPAARSPVDDAVARAEQQNAVDQAQYGNGLVGPPLPPDLPTTNAPEKPAASSAADAPMTRVLFDGDLSLIAPDKGLGTSQADVFDTQELPLGAEVESPFIANLREKAANAQSLVGEREWSGLTDRFDFVADDGAEATSNSIKEFLLRRLETNYHYGQGVLEGFFMDVAVGTIKGIGSLLYFAVDEQWDRAKYSAALFASWFDSSYQDTVDEFAEELLHVQIYRAAVASAPVIQRLGVDVTNLIAGREASPETEELLLKSAFAAHEIYKVVTDYIDTLDDNERAHLEGRIVGAVLFEVALSAATSGAGHALKAGKFAKITRVMDDIGLPASVQTAVRGYLDDVVAAFRGGKAAPESAAAIGNAVIPRLTQRIDAFHAYQANGGTMNLPRWVKATQGNPNYGTGFKSGFAVWSRRVGKPVHGNSLAATGAHDVYVLRDAGSGRLLHFGETGRGYLTRFAEHQRDYAKLGIDIEVDFLRTVDGKAAARSLETRYIEIYIRTFGQRPLFNPVNH